MMSDAVEKAFAAIPGLISGGLTTITAGSPIHVQGFPSFVHKVCSLTSKYEEEQVVKRELTLVKQRLAQPNITQAQQADCLVRLLFAHVLGYDVSFGYISAVKLAQQGTLAYKRMGYLACTLFLHENHELVLLLINTIQKDINSSNIMDVCMALTATCSLVNTEMIPAILPFVQEKLKHQKEIIRKKAVLCLFKFHRMAPNSVQHIHHSFKEALCDKDPGVMWSALHIYHDLIKHSPSEYQDITQSLVSILQQVVSRKLPADYEYHHVPAPWLQIKLLQVLALLGKDQQKISRVIHPVLAEVLQRSESNQNITFGVVYECILTITSISPDTRLLEYAAKCTGKFLRSKANNLRYLGIKALTKVIQVAPQHALDHQMTVIECLEDPDHTIRAKTLELLYRMCNSVNVKVICDKLLEYMEKDTEKSIKGDIANASLRGEDSVLLFAVQTYWELLQRKDVPNKLIQIGAW
ncbi:AP-4 complex subunit epsilon-1, partial [Lingula anatina]|uniref:AP-4 complex subunit epsilon-1 n=1 Tax=Lingula anatina TaxID=7574 RepID=A0A1S3K9M9_LINAN